MVYEFNTLGMAGTIKTSGDEASIVAAVLINIRFAFNPYWLADQRRKSGSECGSERDRDEMEIKGRDEDRKEG